MSSELHYDGDVADYGSSASQEFSNSRPRAGKERSRAPQRGRKRGKGPQSVNGIHKRRRRKIAW